MSFYIIPDLDTITHNGPHIIVYITGLFHIITWFWQHFVALIRRVIRDSGNIYQDLWKLWDKIRRLKGGH